MGSGPRLPEAGFGVDDVPVATGVSAVEGPGVGVAIGVGPDWDMGVGATDEDPRYGVRAVCPCSFSYACVIESWLTNAR
jgi:hypothetical protein